jgi:hypothetical protein
VTDLHNSGYRRSFTHWAAAQIHHPEVGWLGVRIRATVRRDNWLKFRQVVGEELEEVGSIADSADDNPRVRFCIITAYFTGDVLQLGRALGAIKQQTLIMAATHWIYGQEEDCDETEIM